MSAASQQLIPKPRVLFVSYDGLLEPLGQSQILQYIDKLSDIAEISLLSFEKAVDLDDAALMSRYRDHLKKRGIRWIPLRYHKAPSIPATAWDLAVGVMVAAIACLRHRIQIVHARSYPPAVIALALKRLLGTAFLFDMRGLWADQRVECGAWKAGSPAYRMAKWFEKKFLVQADAIVSETRAAIKPISEMPFMLGRAARFEVVPTCTNLTIFKPTPRSAETLRPFTLGFVGSLGVWYDFEEMLDCFSHLRRMNPEARLLVVTRSSHEDIVKRAVRAGLPADSIECVASDFGDVARHIGRMDAGLFILRDCPSMVAVSPTKLGEFLACGVPCLANSGVGDADEVLEGVGVTLDDYSPESKAAAMGRLVAMAQSEGIRERCVRRAVERFDVAGGIATYANLYHDMAVEKQ